MITKRGEIQRHIQAELSSQTDLTPILTKMISKLQASPVLLHYHVSKQLLIMYTFLNQMRIGKNIQQKDDRMNSLQLRKNSSHPLTKISLTVPS